MHHPWPPAGPDQHKLPSARAPSLHSSPRSPPGMRLCPGLSDSEGWPCPEFGPFMSWEGPRGSDWPRLGCSVREFPGGLRCAQVVWLDHTSGAVA